MKLSTRARYSIRLMIYLADHSNVEKPVGLKKIAQNQGLSVRYLEQLVVPLKNSDLIKSVAGKYGGYYLTRKPKEIKVGDVVEAAIGAIRLVDCLEESHQCGYKKRCTARNMWSHINDRITGVLNDYSLEDLSEKKLLEAYDQEDGTTDQTLPC